MTLITDLVSAELDQPVDPRIRIIAAAIAAKHGASSRCVLFYGSCLRQQEIDDLMLDFYLIVSDYASAYPKRWMATANRLIPPNVFPFALDGLAAKYAVLSEADFAHLNGPGASTVSVWARFAQPTRLVWVFDKVARQGCIDSVAKAASTLMGLARPIATLDDPIDVWKSGFSQTYRAELRAEREDRSASIVDADIDRYCRFSAALPLVTTLSREAALVRWRQLQRRGKLYSVLRIAKASFTFADGIDYLAWKINRHAGTAIEIKPWQRKRPLIGALFLLPRLFLKGAVR